MNKVNFLAQKSFPVNTNTFDFLQKMIHLAGNMALLGGDNYILSGCIEDQSEKISEGLIVINGELLPFVGGVKKEKIKIQETKESDHYAGVDYPEAYIHRKVIFADDGDILWDDLKQVLTNKDLEDKINALRGEAPGFVKMWSGLPERLGKEYLLCDGSIVSTAEYPDLAYYLGKEREDRFQLPDLRSRFVVGFDNAEEDYNDIGKKGGAKQKNITEDQMPDHYHIYSDDTNAMGSFILDGKSFPSKVEGINNQESSAKSGGSGTLYRSTSAGKGEAFDVRPPYYVLAFVIRVKY